MPIESHDPWLRSLNANAAAILLRRRKRLRGGLLPLELILAFWIFGLMPPALAISNDAAIGMWGAVMAGMLAAWGTGWLRARRARGLTLRALGINEGMLDELRLTLLTGNDFAAAFWGERLKVPAWYWPVGWTLVGVAMSLALLARGAPFEPQAAALFAGTVAGIAAAGRGVCRPWPALAWAARDVEILHDLWQLPDESPDPGPAWEASLAGAAITLAALALAATVAFAWLKGLRNWGWPDGIRAAATLAMAWSAGAASGWLAWRRREGLKTAASRRMAEILARIMASSS